MEVSRAELDPQTGLPVVPPAREEDAAESGVPKTDEKHDNGEQDQTAKHAALFQRAAILEIPLPLF